MMNIDGARTHDSLAKYRKPSPKTEEYDTKYPDGWSLSRPEPKPSYAEDEDEKKESSGNNDNNSGGGKERWKAWQGGPYEVSSYGRVRRNGKILKPRHNPANYQYINVSKDGEVTQTAVHEMVLRSFGPPPPKGVKNPVIEHNNDHKDDNNIKNLSWGNVKSNTQDAYDSGNYKEKGKADPQRHEQLKKHNTPDYLKK